MGQLRGIILRGGTVYDGSGAPPQIADAATWGDRGWSVGVAVPSP